MDRLSEMEAFAAVVDQGGFTGAAQKLGISKSAVSKHVSSLESRLGARLLNRTTRRVNPTDAGLVYYDRARNVLAAALEADSAVTSLKALPTGTLQLAVNTDFGTTVLTSMIGGFLAEYRDVDVNMVLTSRYVEIVSEGYDLALVLGMRPDSALKSTKIDTVTRYLVASPSYLERMGTPGRIEDLAQHQLLHFHEYETDPTWTLVSPTGETRVVRTKGRLAANSGLCLLENALAGLGIAFLPDFLVRDALSDGRLINAMPALPQQSVSLYAVCPTNRHTQPRVRAFIDYLKDSYAQPIEDASAA